MNALEQFWKKYLETSDLIKRVPAAFPRRTDLATLKARWEKGDPNVMKTDYGDGDVWYELVFTKEQKTELEQAFANVHPGRPDAIQNVDCVEFEAGVFVAVLEGWPSYINDRQAMEPDTQKNRKLAFEPIENAFTKLDQALSNLDCVALGYWYAHITDALAKSGVQLSPHDNQLKSMLDHPLRAQVEAGELRIELRPIIQVIVEATIKAKDTLPKVDRVENDIRFEIARQLEDMIVRQGIDFDVSEIGFPAKCLRLVFDVAGLEVEKVSYWLKKAADHPDSSAKFRERIRSRL